MEKRARTKPTPRATGGGGGGGHPPLVCEVGGPEIYYNGLGWIRDAKDTDSDNVNDEIDLNPVMNEYMRIDVEIKDLPTTSYYAPDLGLCYLKVSLSTGDRFSSDGDFSDKKVRMYINTNEMSQDLTLGLFQKGSENDIWISINPYEKSYTIALTYQGKEATQGYTHYWETYGDLYKDGGKYTFTGQQVYVNAPYATIELCISTLGKDIDNDRIPYWAEVAYERNPNKYDGSVDTDGDGMELWWEDFYFLNDRLPEDANYDSDGDSFKNLWEAKLNRNPWDPKTVYRISLTVSVGWDATQEELEKIKDSFKGASLYMMTVTDGYCYIGDVTIYNNDRFVTFEGKEYWCHQANVRIYPEEAVTKENTIYWPHTKNVEGYWDGILWISIPFGTSYYISGEIVFPKSFIWGNTLVSLGTAAYYMMIVHELGHYVFGLYDEYRSDTPYWDDLYYEDLGSHSLMYTNYYFLSYYNLYVDLYFPYTTQWAYTQKSCWEWFVKRMGGRDAIHFTDEAKTPGIIHTEHTQIGGRFL